MSKVVPTINCVGVRLTAISLVSNPAISSGWRWVSPTELVGPVLVPDRLIYRKDGYFIRFSADEVVNSIFDYFYVEEGPAVFTLQHDGEVTSMFGGELSKVSVTRLWCECPEYESAGEYGLDAVNGAVYIGLHIPEGDLNDYIHSNCSGFSCELECGAEESTLSVVI